MSNFLKLSALALVLVSSVYAEEQSGSSQETVTPTEPAFSGSVFGGVELRPSLETKVGDLTTDNSLELGYRFSPDVSANLFNKIKSNLFNGSRDGQGGADIYTDELYARLKVERIWQNGSKDLSFGIHERIYAPVNSEMIDSGMITTSRTYFNLGYALTPSTTVIVAYVPVFHINTKDSFGGTANKAMENRIELTGVVSLTQNLTLELPFTFYQNIYRNAGAGIAKNNAWEYELDFYPHLIYQVNNNFRVGAAFRSGNLMKTDLSGLSIEDGLEGGTAQLLLGASL